MIDNYITQKTLILTGMKADEYKIASMQPTLWARQLDQADEILYKLIQDMKKYIESREDNNLPESEYVKMKKLYNGFLKEYQDFLLSEYRKQLAMYG